MFKTIRWRFVFIYFMLVFIAMIIAGVFIINSYENYYEKNVSSRLDDLYTTINQRLSQFDDFESEKNNISELLQGYKSIGFNEEIFILSKDSRTISSTIADFYIDPLSILDYDLLVHGMANDSLEAENIDRVNLTYDKIYPVFNENESEKIGYIYIRYDMTDIYRALDQNKIIIVRATALASIITILLGFIIAKSITEPINDLTYKAAKMANGDFNQYVEVKSEDEIGKLAEMFNILTTKLRESISEIHQEKSKMEAIINQMADGLIAIDLNGKIIHINQRAMDILNLDESRMKNLDYNQFVDKYDIKVTLDSIRETNQWIGKETVYGRKSIYSIKYAPYHDQSKNKLGIILIIQDITEEEKLKKMRREFVANVSHELKTPLTTIKSYVETILDDVVEDQETVRHFLTVINNESDRMTRLVRDLLQLSNFDSKKIKFDFEYNDYSVLLKRTVEKMKVTANKKGQKIDLNCSKDEIVGYFDYDRMEQVILNVISNAVKYSKENTIINVKCKQFHDNVRISIKDQGIGIPKKDLDRIFERFYRVDKARSRDLGGTGLGLAIAREIIVAHDGKIDFRSVVGDGTEVIIEIPIKMIEV
ncbi:MAG: ATP-binding protein [Bacillota bacterium]|nr:ATP-binding protein [Bacillota bacterium]